MVGEISDNVNSALEKINNIKPIEEILIDIIMNTVIFILNLLNYFCNIGINIIMLLMIYYNETFNASNLKIKYTKGAYIFLKINNFLHFITKMIKNFLKLIFKTLSKHRRKIALTVLLILLGNGILYQILTEVIIFFVSYIYHAIRLETYLVLSTLGQALFLIIFPKLKMISYPFLIIILLYIVLIKAFQKANLRLRKNHERLKKFAIENLTQTTFINGAPGVGKTLLNVSLTLASEEAYIEILQNLLIEYELKYPEINFAKIRSAPVSYPEHQKYIRIYETLNNRGTFVISNYAIYSPYFKEFSKIFDFDYMRKNIKAKVYPLEEYIVISLSELITERIKIFFNLMKDNNKLIEIISKQNQEEDLLENYKKEELKINKRLEALINLTAKVYDDSLENLIDNNTYYALLKKYQEEQKSLNTRLSEIKKYLSKNNDLIFNINELKKNINDFLDFKELTKEMVLKLISKIIVEPFKMIDGKKTQEITISYRFIKFKMQ